MEPVSVSESVERDLRDLARLHVRTGLLDEGAQHDDLVAAIRRDMPQTDPQIMARAWLAAARKEHAAEAAGWTAPTDHDLTAAAFAECREHGVQVAQGMEAAQLREEVSARPPERGVLWFTPLAVWHAVDHGVLEAHLWHPDGTSAGPGEHLTTAVLGCLSRHGVRARTWEGAVQIATRWQRRP